MQSHGIEWRSTGYPNFYISETGVLKRTEYVLTRCDGRTRRMPERIFYGRLAQGYLYVSLRPHRDIVAVHELVARAFLGPRPEDARTVNHIDGVKTNNHVSNLEWATYAENNRHARKLLLNKQHGERCNLTAFSDDVVDAVRILANSGRFTAKEISRFFGMSATHVYEIKNMVSRTRETSW